MLKDEGGTFLKVLVVCSGNAFRSPVAEALLKKMKPDLEVDSAGTNIVVAPAIAESAKKYVTDEKADQYLKQTPEGVDEKVLKKYDLIIVMTQEHKDVILRKCAECKNKIVVWNIADPYFLPREYSEKIFEQIKSKVIETARSL